MATMDAAMMRHHIRHGGLHRRAGPRGIPSMSMCLRGYS